MSETQLNQVERPSRQDYSKAVRRIEALLKRLDEIIQVSQVLFPMAAGYAREHPVGRNSEIIEWARKEVKKQTPA